MDQYIIKLKILGNYTKERKTQSSVFVMIRKIQLC